MRLEDVELMELREWEKELWRNGNTRDARLLAWAIDEILALRREVAGED